MKRAFLAKAALCIFSLGVCMYLDVDKQNTITKLRMQVPQIAKQIKGVREEISELQYEIERFEHPAHLMELAHRPEFTHLKHPFLKDVLTVPQGLACTEETVAYR